jgi:hypothetical protein
MTKEIRMLKRCFLSVAIAGAALAGCGGDDSTNGDAAVVDNGGSGGAVSGHGGSGGAASGHGGSGGSAGSSAGSSGGGRLESGTYTVSNVAKIKDECGLTLDDGTFKSTELVNTGTKLSIGKSYDTTTDPSWDPAGYGLGTGDYTTATTATLTVSTHEKISDDGCEFDLKRSTKVTYTGDDAVSIDYSDEEMNQNSKCKTDNLESTKDCTSEYTFDLAM